MYKQLVTPNFDPQIVQGATVLTSWLGWCMAYVEQSIGLFYVYSKALAGWNNVKGRHGASEAVPRGVWLPLWFSGWVYRGEEQGHVLWAKFNQDGSGVAWTSPKSNKPYADKINFSSLANLVDQLKKGWASDIGYLGWSEYVGNKQIIEREDMAEKVNLDTARILAHMSLARDGYDGRPSAHAGKTDADLKKNHVGKELTNKYIRDNFFSSVEASKAFGIKDAVYKERDRLRAEVASLKKQLAEKPTSASDAENKLNMIKNALGIK